MVPRIERFIKVPAEVYGRLQNIAAGQDVSLAVMLERLLDMYDRAVVLGLRPAHPLTHQLSPKRKDGTA